MSQIYKTNLEVTGNLTVAGTIGDGTHSISSTNIASKADCGTKLYKHMLTYTQDGVGGGVTIDFISLSSTPITLDNYTTEWDRIFFAPVFGTMGIIVSMNYGVYGSTVVWGYTRFSFSTGTSSTVDLTSHTISTIKDTVTLL